MDHNVTGLRLLMTAIHVQLTMTFRQHRLSISERVRSPPTQPSRRDLNNSIGFISEDWFRTFFNPDLERSVKYDGIHGLRHGGGRTEERSRESGGRRICRYSWIVVGAPLLVPKD